MKHTGRWHKQTICRAMALLLAVILLIPHTALSVSAQDITPDTGVTVGESTDEDTLPADEKIPSENVSPADDIPVVPENDDMPSEDTPVTDIPAFDVPEDGDPQIDPPVITDTPVVDDPELPDEEEPNVADEDTVILQEDDALVTAEAMNEVADYVPAGTEICLEILGPGLFTETVTGSNDGSFDKDYYTYTYTTPVNMQYTDILSYLEKCVRPAMTYVEFINLSSMYDLSHTIQSNAELIALVDNDEHLYAYFSEIEGYRYQVRLSEEGLTDSVYLLTLGDDTLTLHANLSIVNTYTGFEQIITEENLTFEEWYISYDDATYASAPAEITQNADDYSFAQITPVKAGVATVSINLMLQQGRFTSYSPVSAEYRIIVKETGTSDTLSAGTTIQLSIQGNGQFTDTARGDSINFTPADFSSAYISPAGSQITPSVYKYTLSDAMNLDQLSSALSGLTESIAGSTFEGYYITLDFDDQMLTDDVNLLLDDINLLSVVPNKKIYARYVHNDQSASTYIDINTSDGQRHTGDYYDPIRIRLNESDFYISASLVTTEDHQPIQGIRFIWGAYDNEIITLSERTNGNPCIVNIKPHKNDTQSFYICPTTKDGSIFITGYHIPYVYVLIEEPYPKFFYYAYTDEDGSWKKLDEFRHNNPDRMGSGQNTLTLSDAYCEEYRFDGWYQGTKDGHDFSGEPIKTYTPTTDDDVYFYAKFTKIIQPETIGVTNVDDTPVNGTIYLEKGGTASLKAAVTPAEAAQDVVWSSANTAIATVSDDGTITGIKNGSTSVTVRAKDKSDVRVTIPVTVVTAVSKPSSVGLTYNVKGKWTELPKEEGTSVLTVSPSANGSAQTILLHADVKDESGKAATDQTVVWTVTEQGPVSDTSENKPVQIDEDGTVTVQPVDKEWQATITAVSASAPAVSAELTLKIEKTDFHTVTFIADKYWNGTTQEELTGVTNPEAQNIPDLCSIQLPETPTAEGYTFTGWYTEKECTYIYSVSAAVTGDLTLYAGWAKEDSSYHRVTLYAPYDIEHNNTTGSIKIKYSEDYPYRTMFVKNGDMIPIDIIPLYYNPSFFTPGPFMECREHGTDTVFDLKTAVTKDIALDLVYAESALVFLTNAYGSDAVIGDIPLPADYKDYKWSDSVKNQKISDYAGKGQITMEFVHDSGRTVSLPVLFFTLTGIKLDYYSKNTPVIGSNDRAYFDILPVTSGQKIIKRSYSYYDDGETGAYEIARKYIHQCFSENRYDTENNIAPLSLHYDPEQYYPHVYITGNTEKKLTSSFTLTLKDHAGNSFKASSKITVLPTSSYGNFDYYYTPPQPYLDDNPIEADAGQFNVYTVSLQDAQSGKLSIRGIFDSGTDYTRTFTASSSNKKVITVGKLTWGEGKSKREKNVNNFSLALTIKGTGTTQIVLTAKDQLKHGVYFMINVVDNEPTIETTSVKLNKMQTTGVAIGLNAGYGKTLVHPEITSVTPAKKIAGKIKADPKDIADWFVLKEEDSGYRLYISEHADVNQIVNGAYTLTLSDNGKPFKNTLTVNISAALPKVTVRQNGNLNLSDKTSTAYLAFWTNNGDIISNVTFTGSNGTLSPFVEDVKFAWTERDGTSGVSGVYVKKTALDVPVTTKSNKKVTLTFDIAGYRPGAVQKTVTLKVVDKNPAIKLLSVDAAGNTKAASSVTLCPDLQVTDSGPMLVTIGGMTETDLSSVDISLNGALADIYEVEKRPYNYGGYGSMQNGCFVLKKKSEAPAYKAAKGKIVISHPDYEKTFSVSFQVKLQKTASFKPKLNTTTVQLNRNVAQDVTSLFLTSGTTTMPPVKSVELMNGSGVTADMRAKLKTTWDTADNGIYCTIKWADTWSGADDALPAGTYNFTVKVILETGQEYTLPFKLKVVNTAENKTVTIKQSGTLKKAQNNSLTLTTKLSGLNGTVEEVKLGGKDADLFRVFGYGNKWQLSSVISGRYIAKGYAYDVTIASVVIRTRDGGTIEIDLNKKLTVKYK